MDTENELCKTPFWLWLECSFVVWSLRAWKKMKPNQSVFNETDVHRSLPWRHARNCHTDGNICHSRTRLMFLLPQDWLCKPCDCCESLMTYHGTHHCFALNGGDDLLFETPPPLPLLLVGHKWNAELHDQQWVIPLWWHCLPPSFPPYLTPSFAPSLPCRA